MPREVPPDMPIGVPIIPDTVRIVYERDGICVYQPLREYIAANAGVTLAVLTAVIAALPATLPATSGVLWLNGGVIQLS
jgi:hypothetical protein